MASAVPPPNPFKRKRAALPPLPTDRVSRSAAAAAADDDDDDEEERHLAKAFPPSSAKPSGAIMALSQIPTACYTNACTAKALDL